MHSKRCISKERHEPSIASCSILGGPRIGRPNSSRPGGGVFHAVWRRHGPAAREACPRLGDGGGRRGYRRPLRRAGEARDGRCRGTLARQPRPHARMHGGTRTVRRVGDWRPNGPCRRPGRRSVACFRTVELRAAARREESALQRTAGNPGREHDASSAHPLCLRLDLQAQQRAETGTPRARRLEGVCPRKPPQAKGVFGTWHLLCTGRLRRNRHPGRARRHLLGRDEHRAVDSARGLRWRSRGRMVPRLEAHPA